MNPLSIRAAVGLPDGKVPGDFDIGHNAAGFNEFFRRVEAIEQRHPPPIASILQTRSIRNAWLVGGGSLAAAFRMRGLISEYVILKTTFCPRNSRNKNMDCFSNSPDGWQAESLYEFEYFRVFL